MTEQLPNTFEKELKEQRELLEKIFVQNKKILRHMLWESIGTYVRILLIVVPLVLSIIYLPKLLGPVFDQYRQLLSSVPSGGTSLDVQQLLKQYQDTMK